MKIKDYYVYTTDMEFPYALCLSSKEPKKGILVAPVRVQYFRESNTVPLFGFRKKALIMLNQIQIVPQGRLIKRIWDAGEDATAHVLRSLNEMVSGYDRTKEKFF